MKLLISFFCFTLATIAEPIVYLIRHGEKPQNDDGLSTQGLQRAQCLRRVFSGGSQYQIGYIMAEKPRKGVSIRQFHLSRLLTRTLLKTILLT
jgi:hypothetical protein